MNTNGTVCRTTTRRQRSRSLAGPLSRSADWTEELERRLRSKEEERRDSEGSGEYLMGYKGGSQPICATRRSSCGQVSTCGFQDIFTGQNRKFSKNSLFWTLKQSCTSMEPSGSMSQNPYASLVWFIRSFRDSDNKGLQERFSSWLRSSKVVKVPGNETEKRLYWLELDALSDPGFPLSPLPLTLSKFYFTSRVYLQFFPIFFSFCSLVLAFYLEVCRLEEALQMESFLLKPASLWAFARGRLAALPTAFNVFFPQHLIAQLAWCWRRFGIHPIA